MPLVTLPEFDYNARLEDRPLPADWDYKQFWSSYRIFFLERGYTLYDIDIIEDYFRICIPPFLRQQAENLPHPYACFSVDHTELQCVDVPVDHVIYAQDKSKRDVVIKIIKTESNEECIHNLLLRQPQLFNGVLPTIEIIRSPYTFSFVVTPRWGSGVLAPDFDNVQHFLYFIESLLEGLHSLHSNGIVHRDLSWKNVLVNQFHCNRRSHDKDARIQFRENGSIRYCLFDFDLAIIIPQSSSPCLLPIEMANVGSPWHHPSDTDEGSFYDPFKFDVACMGHMFLFYNHLIPIMPLLAPLIDRMSTQDVGYRFTAAEALAFSRYIRQAYTDLNAKLPSQLLREVEVSTDPWEYLPSEYVQLWSPQGEGWATIMSLPLSNPQGWYSSSRNYLE